MSGEQTYFDQETTTRIIDYTVEVEGLRTPDEVLNRLDEITSEKNPIRVHGANRFSVKVGDWRHIELGRNVFVHRDVPQGWLEEWSAFVASGQPIGLMTARTCLAPFTWTELSRLLDPIGIDRWFFELALKHGMRDGYLCPVGGRWAVAFWSPGVLNHNFTQQARGLLNMAASAAAGANGKKGAASGLWPSRVVCDKVMIIMSFLLFSQHPLQIQLLWTSRPLTASSTPE